MIHSKFKGDPKFMDKLTGLLLAIFRFRKFTESRWTSIGESSRTLVASVSVRLTGLVDYARRRQSTTSVALPDLETTSSDTFPLLLSWPMYQILSCMRSWKMIEWLAGLLR